MEWNVCLASDILALFALAMANVQGLAPDWEMAIASAERATRAMTAASATRLSFSIRHSLKSMEQFNVIPVMFPVLRAALQVDLVDATFVRVDTLGKTFMAALTLTNVTLNMPIRALEMPSASTLRALTNATVSCHISQYIL